MTYGIDISAWQKGLSLEKAMSEGVKYAIIKFAGADAGRYKDSQCEKFYAEAQRLGLPVGAYYFSKCSNASEAIEEAKHFLSTIKGKTFPCKVWYDIEGNMVNLPKETLSAIAKAFCKYMKDNGYECGVYTNASTFNKIDYDGSFSKLYPKWVAYWGKSKPSMVRDGVDMWQYGGTTNLIRSNKVAGMVVDQDYCYFDIGAVPAPVPVEDPIAKPTLKKGSNGSEVVKLQQNLNQFGYMLAVDGDFGTNTDRALRGWQKATGLTVDGSYGPASYAKMKEIL